MRPQGVHKGRVVPAILAAGPESAAILAIGDDRTDEDVFAAAPPTALTIHVGAEGSRARYRLADPAAVRRSLSRSLEHCSSPWPAPFPRPALARKNGKKRR